MRKSVILLMSLLLMMSFGVSAASGEESPPPDRPVEVNEDALTNELEELLYPPLPDALIDAARTIGIMYDGDDRFGGIALDDDHTGLVVKWYGEVEAQLAETIDAYSLSVEVVVAPVTIAPGELREVARTLLSSDLSIGEVTGAGLNADGTGLDVIFAPSGFARIDPTAALSSIAGVPVAIVGSGDNIPVVRRYDSNHFGGARVYEVNGGGCTTGWPVTNGSTQGLMFAAHCGSNGVGATWYRESATASPPAYYYGTNVIQNWNNDGAILESNFANPGVYIGVWNNTNPSALRVGGSIVPFVGGELCYQGSYSGQSCGNVITHTDFAYRFTDDGVQRNFIFGVRTSNKNGNPAAGNGDSGGPGHMVSQASNGNVYARPAVVISAIESSSASTTCQGVAGYYTSPQSFRRCSPVVFGGTVWRIEQETGWSVMTAP